MAATIREVARKAGVTIGTVSRVFNHYPDVSPETKKKVFSAAKTLNYVPNANARSLSAKKPPNLCFIASSLLHGDDRDSMLYLLIKGIIQYATAHQLEFRLYSTDSSAQDQQSFTDFCKLHAISGAIVCGVKIDDPYFCELVDSGIPVVGIDIPLEGEHAGWISVDNTAAVAEAVSLLFAKGFERLMIAAGKQRAAVNQMRLEGVYQAFLQAGRTLSDDQIIFGDFNEDVAFEKTARWLESHPAPDAVFCFSDIMALGVLKALRKAGLRVPEDVSVMGFDGMPFTSLTTPTLSTVHQPMQRMGYEAARMVHEMMQEQELKSHHRIIPYELVLRESVR